MIIDEHLVLHKKLNSGINKIKENTKIFSLIIYLFIFYFCIALKDN